MKQCNTEKDKERQIDVSVWCGFVSVNSFNHSDLSCFYSCYFPFWKGVKPQATLKNRFHSSRIEEKADFYNDLLLSFRRVQDASQMNNVVPTSPLLPQMSHPHSYPNMGQITNPYEQQPPGKELNKYASLKAVADKVNDDFYSKRRHLAELAAKGSLPLHPVRMEEDRTYAPDNGTTKHNGQKSKITKIHTHPMAYNYKTWDPSDQSFRRQAYANKGKHGPGEPMLSNTLTTRSQQYLPPQPYFITNSKTEVTV
ncbi:protein shisa-9 isoform A [Alligator mississippiensis]|uniref:Protein shisa-9 isoform A n=1 Tax=Alligator mississippiensis TaxID=8496 RepID=A0A151N142_ALLMI|nr:protein shisa-9 isoform A [Alligator mississippiensis]